MAQRARSHRVLQDVRRDRATLDAYWRATELPDGDGPERTGTAPDGTERTATPAELRALRAKLAERAAAWNTAGPEQRWTTRLRDRAVELATCLHDAGDALHTIARGDRSAVDRDGTDQERLRPMVDLLVQDGAGVDDVLRNMLRLEVMHVAFTRVTDTAEQAVELVQVSSLREELVTGIQLHHLGAFYRRSWRANDWLRGRIDGSEQLVQILLAPERLRQLGIDTVAEALAVLEPVAVGPPGTERHLQLTAAWEAVAPQLTQELEVLAGVGPLPRPSPLTAKRIAHRIRAEFLREELDSLAGAVVGAPDPVKPAVQWADRAAADLHGHQDAGTEPGVIELDNMLKKSEVVGRQTIAAEADQGSDTFAQTVSHAAATLTATGAAIKKPKSAVTLLKAPRGYALLWVLVNFATGGSHVGRNLTNLAVGVGGALVALALLVPGVPAAVPLTGVVLILAAASAAALANRKLSGWWLVLRLALITLVLLAALLAIVWQRAAAEDQGFWETVKDIGLPALVVVLVVGLGWIVGYPSRRAS